MYQDSSRVCVRTRTLLDYLSVQVCSLGNPGLRLFIAAVVICGAQRLTPSPPHGRHWYSSLMNERHSLRMLLHIGHNFYALLTQRVV